MNNHLVFVYGTLRRGDVRSMSIRFPQSKFIADAEVNGALYDLGTYPGLLLNESNSLVIVLVIRKLITSGDWIEYAKTKTDWPGDASSDDAHSHDTEGGKS